jgi:hypothetical protein
VAFEGFGKFSLLKGVLEAGPGLVPVASGERVAAGLKRAGESGTGVGVRESGPSEMEAS